MNIQLAFFCCFEVDEPSFPLRSSPCPSLADEVPHLREDGADGQGPRTSRSTRTSRPRGGLFD